MSERLKPLIAKYLPPSTPCVPLALSLRRGPMMAATGKAKAMPRTAPGPANAH